MLERLQPILRIVSLLLAGLVIYQLSQIVAKKDPLENLGLTATFAALSTADAPAASPGTNTVRGTNAVPSRESANGFSSPMVTSSFVPIRSAVQSRTQ